MTKILLLLTFYLFVFPTTVNAYLDPGTGSYITQVLIGFTVGGGYLFKIYWEQIKSRFQNKKNTKKIKKSGKNDAGKKD